MNSVWDSKILVPLFWVLGVLALTFLIVAGLILLAYDEWRES